MLSRDHEPLPLLEDNERLMSRAEVCRFLGGVSYVTIWKKMGDGTFPRPLKISRNRVAWLRSEILAHIRALPRQTYKQS
jgi:predicted DNA-binding transcriptional regulator AlpA